MESISPSRICLNLKKMLEDRGYADVRISENDVKSGPFFMDSSLESRLSIFVFFLINFAISKTFNLNIGFSKKETHDFINYFILHAHQVQTDKIILIVPGGLQDKISSIVADYIEVHSEESLMYNPTINFNVPKHYKCDIDDLKILEKRCIKAEDLPEIKHTDPIVKWYGFKKGDIVKINRSYCDEIYYRIVI